MIDLHSLSNFCPSGVFNNPGKIIDACFRHGDYDSLFVNPCTGAIAGLFLGALTDGTGGSIGGSDYYHYNSGTTVPITPTVPTAPTGDVSDIPTSQPDLSDFLPDDYRETPSSITLGDVVD